jgi:hypothetical protein
MFVGWDWASATHAVTVLDDAGVVVDRWAFRHTEQDLVGALERLARLAEPAALPVIIERASGLVVERLLAAGHPVVPVHPLRSGPPARGGARRGRSLIPATATSSPTTPTTRPPGRCPARPSTHGQLLPPPQLPRRQGPGPAAGQAPLRTDRSSRHPGRHPGDPCPPPGRTPAHPAWDHRRARRGDRHPRRCLSPRPTAGGAARCRHHQPGPAAGRGPPARPAGSISAGPPTGGPARP